MRSIIVIAHDMRSTHNVGSLFRTAEGLGIEKIYLTGYTPHPRKNDDDRLPHIVEKLEKQLDKTALGATNMVDWEYKEDVRQVIDKLKSDSFEIIALEQAPNSVNLPDYDGPDRIALLLGTEVTGLPPEILQLATVTCEIPMFGKKESFNVVQAAAMALYKLRFD